MNPPEVDNRGGATDGRQGTFVYVAERLERLAANRMNDVARRMPPFLHRGRSDSRHRLSVLLQRSEIADDEHTRLAPERQIGPDHDSPCPVQRHAERAREWRRRDGRAVDMHSRSTRATSRAALAPRPR